VIEKHLTPDRNFEIKTCNDEYDPAQEDLSWKSRGATKLIHACLHVCEKFFSLDGMTKYDSKIGPLVVMLINRIKANTGMNLTKVEPVVDYPFLQMDIERWRYYIENSSLKEEKMYSAIHNWRFMDYEIAFVGNGANFIKQGSNSGFKKMNEVLMKDGKIFSFGVIGVGLGVIGFLVLGI
jgi:hypothetical protein